MWRPQLAALADEFTVVAWDEPGAGRSSDLPADFALADYANCLAALIEALYSGRTVQHVETQVKFEDGRTGIVAADLAIAEARTFAASAGPMDSSCRPTERVIGPS